MEFDLASLFRNHDAESRSLSAENFRGEKGGGGMASLENSLAPGSAQAARDLGQGWKVSPCLPLAAGQSVDIMDNDGPGVIRHIWMTPGGGAGFFRKLVLRVYWDGEKNPSVECPLGDFFCNSWNAVQSILALPINVNSSGGLNSYLPMPFRKHARISVHNDSAEDLAHFFYTINYTLEPVEADALCFHAQWRRRNPLEYGQVYTILDGVRGRGKYAGTFMAWQQNNAGWWGEGEIKMYLDGDGEFPTICGTGTEDYFGGGWCFKDGDYSAPFLGYRLVSGERRAVGSRLTMYRFHVPDPVFFKKDLKVTMQALGWREDRRYLPLQDDIASTAYWYQTEPHGAFPELPGRDLREIV